MVLRFPRFSTNAEEKESFWNLLESIKNQAVKVEGEWQNFYYATTYTMKDGRQYLYLEDTEYGIPNSIEWL